MKSSQNTKRPQNKCGSCGYTWYPRGGNLSAKCPKCGSSKTKKMGIGIFGALLFAYIFSGGNNHSDKNANVPTAISTTTISLPADLNDDIKTFKADINSSIATNNNQPISAVNAQEVLPPLQTNSSIDAQSENELKFAEILIAERNYSAAKELVKQVLVKHPENQRAKDIKAKITEEAG